MVITDEKEIWKEIRKQTGSVTFTAALMAHMKAESALRSNNLQNSYERKIGLNDEQYTNAVDSGEYNLEKFAHDSAGYGLCQWTYWSRKQDLYNFWNDRYLPEVSIGDTEMQIDFCIWELSNHYLSIWGKRFEMDLREAVEVLHKQYERPADQSTEAITRRYNIAWDLWNKYHDVMPDADASGEQMDNQSLILAYLKSIKEDAASIEALLQGRIGK